MEVSMELTRTDSPRPDWPLQTVGHLWVFQGPSIDGLYAMVKEKTVVGIMFSVDPRFELNLEKHARTRDFVDIFLPWGSFAFQALNEQFIRWSPGLTIGPGLDYLSLKVVSDIRNEDTWRFCSLDKDTSCIIESISHHWSTKVKLAMIRRAYFSSRRENGNNYSPTFAERIAVNTRSAARYVGRDTKLDITSILLRGLQPSSEETDIVTELLERIADREILFDFWLLKWSGTFTQAKKLAKAICSGLTTEQAISWIGERFGANVALYNWSSAVTAEVIRRIKKLSKEEQRPLKELLLDRLTDVLTQNDRDTFTGLNELARLFDCTPDQLFKTMWARQK